MAKRTTKTKAAEGGAWSLAEFVDDFEDQLRAIQRRSAKGAMALTEVSLTLGVTATKTAEGGVDLRVLQVTGGVSRADERTITVKFEVLNDRVLATARSSSDVLEAVQWSEHAQTHVHRRPAVAPTRRRATSKKAVKKRAPAKKAARRAKKAARRR